MIRAAAMAAAGAVPLGSAIANDLRAEVDPSAMLARLVRRTSFGPSPEEMTRAAQLGFSEYLEYQLNHLAIDDIAAESRVHEIMRLPFTPRYIVNSFGPNDLPPIIGNALIIRAALSRRQLFQRMVEFWNDHFNVHVNDDQQMVLKILHDREIIRPNALRTFHDLLRANLQSPSMLVYLDNHLNVAGRPNENLAREMMELHTLGFAAPYTQRDVEEFARCLTGWSSIPWRNVTDPDYGLFVFNADQHDNGEKLFLGQVIPAGGGMQDGFRAIEILLDHPSTAKHIAEKLTKWFLGDQPPMSIVNAATSTFTSTKGDIKAMIRTILTPDALFQVRPKIKRPLHVAVSFLRAVSSTLPDPTDTRYWVGDAGHSAFSWGPPNGYPDSASYWGRSVIQRWRLAGKISTNTYTGTDFYPEQFFFGAVSPEDAAALIDERLFQGDMDPLDREHVRSIFSFGFLSLPLMRNSISLAVASPSFQWY